jgi:hypothetical protein
MTPNEVLGVRPGATAREVRRAYRSYALRHHPDRGGRRDRFELGSAAYQSLLADSVRHSPSNTNVVFHRQARGWHAVMNTLVRQWRRVRKEGM